MADCSEKMFAEGRDSWAPRTLRHWCRTVRTLRHQSGGAEMSWVQRVLGHKCLDTVTIANCTAFGRSSGFFTIVSRVLP